ncbi:MAG: uncharacterized protein QG670_1096 [Thermoproteota archaeon]|nr:uncharacterized protein [Thermoproteota archaeon]
MKKTGVVELPLHYGKAPTWLVKRMQGLAREIVSIIIDEYGQEKLLQRLADPFWFQALGCVLGYDWHSSGVTTVVTGVLKSLIVPEEQGIAVVGGKGKASTHAQDEIIDVGMKFGLSEEDIKLLRYSSRMSAKVDNTAIQADYPLYHHTFFICENKKWAVIQQGMNISNRTARRYHWLSDNVKSFIVEPHEAVVCDIVKERVLNMTAKESEKSRKAAVDLVNEEPKRVERLILSLRHRNQSTLENCMRKEDETKDYTIDFFSMPWNINWKALETAYEFQPKNYEELLGIRGIGSATVRGLALVSEIIYGEKPSWTDPVKYSFAYGGKDGVPFPVDRRSMDSSIEFLREAVEQARIGHEEKLSAFKRLKAMVTEE